MNLKRIYRYMVIVSLSFFLTVNLPLAWGEPVTTIRDNGDPTNRVDFVILGDGYTAGELTKYANDVENAVNGFFYQEPYKEYQKYFNVHRVDVISNESGADHPPVYKDTAFDATYNCAGIQRLICVNISKVNTVLSNSVNPDQRDMVLVLVNDTEYGGSGGAIAVASTHAAAIELVLHETGHSFGLLADEYDYGTCNIAVEPSSPNVTMETNRNLIKWNIGGGPPTGWIDPATPIPTDGTSNGIPGLYEGAQYCYTGKYRPTFNSKMRSLSVPFEQINEEQLVKRVYNWVSPLDSSTPPGTQLMLEAGKSQLFQIQVLEPLTHALDVKWYVDDQYKSGGLQFTFDSTIFGQGLHTVEVVLRDYTSKVRYDPANVLIEQRIWDVAVESFFEEELIFFDDYQDQNLIPTVGTYVQLTGNNTIVDRGGGDYWLQSISGVVQASPTKAAGQINGSYDFAIDTSGIINTTVSSHWLNFRPLGAEVVIGWGLDGKISWNTYVGGVPGPYGNSNFTWTRGTDYHITWSIDAVADTVSFAINNSPILNNFSFGGDFTHLYGLAIAGSTVNTVPILLDNIQMNSLTVFADVPTTYWAYTEIMAIYDAGITTGCSTNPLMYCPLRDVNRSQMAVFLERGINDGNYTPPPATGIFDDVSVDFWAADWIEQLYKDGITTGCTQSPLKYCPNRAVNRAQMAVFLLRSKYDSNYTPPKATGIFADVPITYWAADWIEQLYKEGITTGCSTNPLKYCPLKVVNRAQMAVFLMRTFGL